MNAHTPTNPYDWNYKYYWLTLQLTVNEVKLPNSQVHLRNSVLHGHRCRWRCPTRVRVSDSLEFLGTRQITLGIRHGCGVSDSAKKLRHGCPGNTGGIQCIIPFCLSWLFTLFHGNAFSTTWFANTGCLPNGGPRSPLQSTVLVPNCRNPWSGLFLLLLYSHNQFDLSVRRGLIGPFSSTHCIIVGHNCRRE